MTDRHPFEYRSDLYAQRASTDCEGYLDEVWARRDRAYAATGGKTKAQGAWPFVRAADQSTEARVDVTRLPLRIRSAAR